VGRKSSDLRGNERRLLAGENTGGRLAGRGSGSGKHAAHARAHHFPAQGELLLKNAHVELFCVGDNPLVLGVASLEVQAAAVHVGAHDAGVQARAAEFGSENHHARALVLCDEMRAALRGRRHVHPQQAAASRCCCGA
jgi:hypothetical protein